jgi:hypothetical protein
MVATSDFSGLVKFRLRFRKRSGDRPNGFARPLHGASQNSRRSRLIAPDFERLARTPWPVAYTDLTTAAIAASRHREWSQSNARFGILPR